MTAQFTRNRGEVRFGTKRALGESMRVLIQIIQHKLGGLAGGGGGAVDREAGSESPNNPSAKKKI